MFHVDFDRESIRELSENKRDSLDSVSEMNLRYGYFSARVHFAVDGIDHSFPRITLLDFMFCLLLAADEVRHGRETDIDFTENDMTIAFRPVGSNLTVLRSWDPTVGQCGIDEFLSGVPRFVEAGLEFITQKYPLFAENPTYHKLIALNSKLQN